MGLDISLYVEIYEISPKEISANIQDWDRIEKRVKYDYKKQQWLNEIYCDNITHNVTRMADAVGLYQPIWRPDENKIITAKDLIDILHNGLLLLKSDPEKYKLLEPENKWGRYSDFIIFIEDLLKNCIKYPNATIEVSR